MSARSAREFFPSGAALTRLGLIDDFEEPIKHAGEEFIYVLEGTIEVHLQFYTSVVLNVGQGIYLDSSMGHSYVAKDCESALVLAAGPSCPARLLPVGQQ